MCRPLDWNVSRNETKGKQFGTTAPKFLQGRVGDSWPKVHSKYVLIVKTWRGCAEVLKFKIIPLMEMVYMYFFYKTNIHRGTFCYSPNGYIAKTKFCDYFDPGRYIIPEHANVHLNEKRHLKTKLAKLKPLCTVPPAV